MRHPVRSITHRGTLWALSLIGALILVVSGRCRATTYATWIMVWHGSDQAWWSEKSPDGLKCLVAGKWKTLNWCDNAQIEAHLDGIKKAGVTVVIADLTNGWNWLDSRCQYIQSLCAKKGMKFCVAENSGGNVEQFENHARDIWRNFAGPDAPYHDAYLRYHGKPLIVCYAIRTWYRSYLAADSPFRGRFSLVWTSGEDSCADKWGWQLEPWVGSIPSSNEMFVTSSVRWNPADGAMWRKSLAWLDYNFALARKSDPEYVTIGSYDDPTERNSWLVSETSRCDPGRQMRDRTGALSRTAYYDRVRQWISGKPSFVPGGLLRDGAYRIANRSNGRYLAVLNAAKPNQGAPGALLTGSDKPGRAPVGLFWLYHLGGNHYRIIALHSGLAFEGRVGSDVIQTWDRPNTFQRWTLTRAPGGLFRITNDATGRSLALADSVTLAPPSADPDQQWRLIPVITL